MSQNKNYENEAYLSEEENNFDDGDDEDKEEVLDSDCYNNDVVEESSLAGSQEKDTNIVKCVAETKSGVPCRNKVHNGKYCGFHGWKLKAGVIAETGITFIKARCRAYTSNNKQCHNIASIRFQHPDSSEETQDRHYCPVHQKLVDAGRSFDKTVQEKVQCSSTTTEGNQCKKMASKNGKCPTHQRCNHMKQIRCKNMAGAEGYCRRHVKS